MNKVLSWVEQTKGHRLLFFLFLVAIGAVVFYYRYPFNFTHPNFYAEDGSIFYADIRDHGLVKASLTSFNGYLVVGQYLLTQLAIIGNRLFGHGFATMPQAMAATSYLTLAVAASLPWLLLRKHFGLSATLITWAVLLFFPVGGYDYAVIGTVANLKFLFLYLAGILIIYRQTIAEKDLSRQIIAVDAALLLCVLTNIFCIALLPFLLSRIEGDRLRLLVNRGERPNTLTQWSLAIFGTALAYAAIVYLSGATSATQYLDGALVPVGIVNAIYSSSWYGLTFPIATVPITLSLPLVALLIGGALAIIRRWQWTSVIFAAIVVGSVGFVIVRPGVTGLLALEPTGGWPVHFFYGSAMLFLVLAVLLLSRFIPKTILAVATVVFVLVGGQFSGVRSKSFESIRGRGTLRESINNSCTYTTDDPVHISIYPASPWEVSAPREEVCPLR